MNTLRFSAAVNVDKGLVRDNNEDNFYFNGKFLDAQSRDHAAAFVSVPSESIQVYGVFDGMGGEAMGEEASLIAAQALSERRKAASSENSAVRDAVLEAVGDANERICELMLQNQKKRSGSTFAAVHIDSDKVSVFNVGDSRVYLFRDGKLTQLSEDDTFVQRLINLDVITPEEAKTHRDRHKLTQHLGIFPDEMVIEPHISEEIPLHEGDRLLLCSDGLYDMVSEEQISDILSSDAGCADMTTQLTAAALANGGADNVTSIVICAHAPAKDPISKAYIRMIPIIVAILCGVGIMLYSALGGIKEPSDTSVTAPIETVLVEGLPDTLSMKVGEVRPLTFSVTPEEQTADVMFTSDNASVASVFDDGMIEAHKVGSANIHISAPGFDKTLRITVTDN